MSVSTDTGTNAYDTLASAFAQYGLQSLLPKIKEYMQSGITDQASLMLTLRASAEYKARFPAMAALNQKGRGFSEADYINYERNAAQTEQQYGFPKGFLTDSHRIAGMLENDVSASELNDRAKINAAVSLDASKETKDALSRLYGLDQGAVAAFYFDPDNSIDYLAKQSASAQIAGQAARQQVDIDRATAESLQAQGITDSQAAQGFATVAGLGGLQTGAGEVVTQQDLVGAAFGKAPEGQKVQRVAAGRAAQFQSGGSAQATQGGISGLGQSATR